VQQVQGSILERAESFLPRTFYARTGRGDDALTFLCTTPGMPHLQPQRSGFKGIVKNGGPAG
jgi:hypothetical protein